MLLPPPPPPIQSSGSGTCPYTVNADDAEDGVITIVAEFIHSNLIPDPIYFANAHPHITVTWGDGGNLFENRIVTVPKGDGAISYSSSDNNVATVDTNGMVNILKAGTVTITAEKQADGTYAPATSSYILEIHHRPVTITLSVADKYYDGTTTATVTGTPTISGQIVGGNVSVNQGTAAFADENAGNGKTVTFSGWSLGGTDAENYVLQGPVGVTANIMPKPLTLTGAGALSPLDITTTVAISGTIGSDPATFTSANLPAGLAYDNTAKTLAYDGAGTFANPSVTIGFTVTASSNYANTANLTISVFDGQANHTGASGTYDRRIPVRQGNITVFNNYTTDTTTRAVGVTRHYKLMENVDMDEAVPNPQATGNWSAIGYFTSNNDNAYFTGSFDGQGRTIANLTITRTADNQGMFGRIGSGSIVQNVKLVDGGISGRQYVGGIAGWSAGTVQNCSTTGNVITNTSSIGRTNNYVGGVVGYNSGTVQYCYATGNITGDWYYVGGVVGSNEGGTVQYCYATGNINNPPGAAGGVVGYNGGTQNNNAIVRNCYATGDVNTSSTGDSNSMGGVVGNNFNYGTVQNCYATGNIRRIGTGTGGGNVGGVTGTGNARNCVALNPNVLSGGSNSFARVAGYNSGLANNYAREDMNIRSGWDGNSNTSGTAKPITNNVNGMDGSGVTATQYNNEAWWKNIANWDTTTGSAWDFDTVWRWDSVRNLPALRNVGE